MKCLVLAPLGALALLAGCVGQGQAPEVPLVYAAGADAAAAGLVVAPDGASFAAALAGVPEATVEYGQLLMLTNADSRTRVATLTAARVDDPLVTEYRVDWMDGDTLVATLDLKADSPSASFDVPSGRTLTGRATLTLASGAGAVPVSIATAVSA